MKDYFFDDIFLALLYIVFIVVVPIIAILFQFSSNDSTMYLSYIVAGFALTFDYLSLLRQQTSKRLFLEGLISAGCFCVVFVVGIIKLNLVISSLSSKQAVLTYGFWDFLVVSVLDVMVVTNVYEFGGFVKYEINRRYSKAKRNNQALVEGAKYI